MGTRQAQITNRLNEAEFGDISKFIIVLTCQLSCR